MGGPHEITRLLLEWRNGDEGALNDLIPMVYDDLRRIARRCMAGERRGHSLQATALVNEAFLRLVEAQQVTWQDRAHFLSMAARLMRRVLVDAARARRSKKRGGGEVRVTLTDGLAVASPADVNLEALNDALEALAVVDERKARMIELRYFGGLSATETAAVLKISMDTVTRDWKFAKAWLGKELRPPGAASKAVRSGAVA